MTQENTQDAVSKDLHVSIAKPKISGNLVDLFPCLQPPEVREEMAIFDNLKQTPSEEMNTSIHDAIV